ncbi:MAG: Uma2 family endonuclease [Planctomycetes bacterium]|nr:Uma2 family endonuclease [Planctomycetota bacterium]
MAQLSDFTSTTWTAVDLVHRFGAIPLDRVVHDPAPGTATVADVVRLDDHENRLCELIDGTLVEKTVGVYESFLAIQIGTLLNLFVTQAKLGIVAGADGMMQIFPDQVRIPDVSFISWEHLKDSGFPDNPAPFMAPTLAVEIISRSNTAKEMDRKLGEYFEAGTQQVWYVYPKPREVKVYSSPTNVTTLGENDTLTGGELLPGLSIDLKAFFTLPTESDAAAKS